MTLIGDRGTDEPGLFCACRDITERKRSQQRVDYLAYHDALTDLPNRLLFKEGVEQAIARADRQDAMVALVMIDLDHFKHINDTLGHTIGDRVLVGVAQRLQETFRREDLIARLSGDEFTVVLEGIKDGKSVEGAMQKLLEAFRQPIEIDEYTLAQNISVGISLYPQDGRDVESLMKNADAAMYLAKEEGRQGYRFYTPQLTDSAYENLLYRSKLRTALDKNEFELRYQPLISLRENRVVGVEALIRWQHPELGLVSPDKFIKYAEESNLIIPMGEWVIAQGCRQLNEWRGNGVNLEYISINLSGVQLQHGLADSITRILYECAIEPRYVEFEITETALMEKLKDPVTQLQQLQQLGVRLAIDDFGVGYSSLSQLKQLPIYGLKIDRSFVGDIVVDRNDLAIVEAIVALGNTLQLCVTGEGVETEQQHRLLYDLGCERAQGYFYAKPVEAAALPETIAAIQQRLDALATK